MTKHMQISDELFKKMSILKEGLEISWTDYLTRLEANSTRMYRLEKELLKANELLELARGGEKNENCKSNIQNKNR